MNPWMKSNTREMLTTNGDHKLSFKRLQNATKHRTGAIISRVFIVVAVVSGFRLWRQLDDNLCPNDVMASAEAGVLATDFLFESHFGGATREVFARVQSAFCVGLRTGFRLWMDSMLFATRCGGANRFETRHFLIGSMLRHRIAPLMWDP